MASFRELKRRSLLPLAALGLAAYYALVFLPLSRRADSLDEPLQRAWRRLAISVDQSNATTLDFRHVANQLQETRQALAALETAKKKEAARLEVGPALRARLSAPFQLVDFQNERSKQMDDLESHAKGQQVTLDPAVLAGFPEYTTEIKEPALLWAALALTEDLLEAAVRCKVTAVHSLEEPLTFTNAPAAELAGHWAEVPLQLEFTAQGDAALQFIRSLPLRADEMRAAGLSNAPPDKAPLFIDRVIVRKQSPDKPDEVRVWLQAVGFVLRE